MHMMITSVQQNDGRWLSTVKTEWGLVCFFGWSRMESVERAISFVIARLMFRSPVHGSVVA